MKIDLRKGNCLELMKDIPDKSIDMILCDLPYGTTKCKWDTIIPFEPLWEQYNRVIKDNGAIVLFADGARFSAQLIGSNIEKYRHKWVWNKNNSAGFVTAKIRPFQICEDILVFGKSKVNYYPIMEQRGKERIKGGYSVSDNYDISPTKSKSKNNLYYPKNLLNYSNAVQVGKLHPTQKPVALLEYLIKTYTNEGETVLDNCMGSGSTGVACINTNRNFIGIELGKDESGYFEVAENRIKKYILDNNLQDVELKIS